MFNVLAAGHLRLAKTMTSAVTESFGQTSSQICEQKRALSEGAPRGEFGHLQLIDEEKYSKYICQWKTAYKSGSTQRLIEIIARSSFRREQIPDEAF
jgi:hypothetical protein